LYHSTLGLRVIKQKKKELHTHREDVVVYDGVPPDARVGELLEDGERRLQPRLARGDLGVPRT